MGWRTRRRARRLDRLISELEQIQLRAEAPPAGQQRDEAAEAGSRNLIQDANDYTDKARYYETVFRTEGQISDPEFDDWFNEARAFVRSAQP
jgi:hypothetical protein